MRKGYVKSVNSGENNYYLYKYLNFLRPHIKKQPCVKKRSPDVPISLDSHSNKQQENLKSKVKFEISEIFNDKGDKENISSNMKNNVEIKRNLKSKVETITRNSLPEEETSQIFNDTGNKQNISSKDDDNDTDCWDIVLQDDYFDRLNSMLLKVPQYNKISCMIEVFQAIEYYTHFHNN